MTKLATFHVPTDPPLLAALGEIALRHEHLNHLLKMTIKSLENVSVEEAIGATRYQGSRQLRERVAKLARQRLGEGEPLIRLQALVAECERVTEARNGFIHGLWAKELDGDPHVRDEFGESGPVPTLDELRTLAKEIELVANKLNEERLFGFLAKALQAKRPRELCENTAACWDEGKEIQRAPARSTARENHLPPIGGANGVWPRRRSSSGPRHF